MLGRAAASWAAAAGVDEPDQAVLRRLIGGLPGLLAGRASVLVHGDLVPVNVLVRDGELVGVLDLEATRRADRLFDAAWFNWIVTYHHPHASAAARAGFGDGVGVDLDAGAVQPILVLLPILRILEILARLPSGSEARDRWVPQLRAAIANGAARLPKDS